MNSKGTLARSGAPFLFSHLSSVKFLIKNSYQFDFFSPGNNFLVTGDAYKTREANSRKDVHCQDQWWLIVSDYSRHSTAPTSNAVLPPKKYFGQFGWIVQLAHRHTTLPSFSINVGLDWAGKLNENCAENWAIFVSCRSIVDCNLFALQWRPFPSILPGRIISCTSKSYSGEVEVDKSCCLRMLPGWYSANSSEHCSAYEWRVWPRWWAPNDAKILWSSWKPTKLADEMMHAVERRNFKFDRLISFLFLCASVDLLKTNS